MITQRLSSSWQSRELAEKAAVAGCFYMTALLASTLLLRYGFSAPTAGAACAIFVATGIPLTLWWRHALRERRAVLRSLEFGTPVPAGLPVESSHLVSGEQTRLLTNHVSAATAASAAGVSTLAHVIPQEIQKRRLVVLLIGTDPRDSSSLLIDREFREIDQALASALPGSECALYWHQPSRVAELQRHLRKTRPHVLHFCGHGSLELRNKSRFDSRRLFGLALNLGLRLVVLNACYSEKQAQRIAERIDCVVRLSSEAGAREALRFSTAFYGALASGQSIRSAVSLARHALAMCGLGDELTPRLLARRCDPDTVFLVDPRRGDR